MRRDVSKQETSHTNKWLGKQRTAGEKSQEEQIEQGGRITRHLHVKTKSSTW